MTDQKMQVKEPRAPHEATLADPQLQIRDAARSFLVTYCPRHRCGGIYDIEGKAWELRVPINFGTFLQFLENSGIRLEDGPALETFHSRVEAVTLEVTGGPAH